LHILWSLGLGGAETWLVQLLKNINREKYHLDVLIHQKEPGFYGEEVRSLGSKIIIAPSPLHPLRHSHFLKKVLKDNAYDIVHSHLAISGYLLRLSYQVGVPGRIAHSHTDELAKLGKFNLWRRFYINLSTKWIQRYANLGIAVSDLAARGRFGPNWQTDNRFKILPCGIELGPFSEVVDSKAVRAELGIPEDVCVIGHVGSFRTPKNHAWIVTVAAEVIKRSGKVRFLFVGDGPLRSTIEEKIKNAGLADKAIFLGRRNDIAKLLLGAIDIFLFPSIYEGMPLSMVEAQAAGLPCIVSDSIAEEATVIKPLVYTVSLNESASRWADIILSVIDERSVMPQAEILKIMKNSHFNVCVGVRQIEEWYRELSPQN
jgi:glycosyltransferase involved in cell wall biosynthesis